MSIVLPILQFSCFYRLNDLIFRKAKFFTCILVA